MEKEIFARKDFLLFRKVEEELGGMKSKLILSPDILNPNLMYGEVVSVGEQIADIEVGHFIYASKAHCTEINISTEKLFSTKDEFIVAIVKTV